MPAKEQWILDFEQMSLADVSTVGGKNASLGEMIQNLASQGIQVPAGFATTANAYRHFLKASGLDVNLQEIFADLKVDDVQQLQACGHKARTLLLNAEVPADLSGAILSAYRRLCDRYGPDTDVAVRSSATAEDLPNASFAGQQETYLNVHGDKAVLEACRRCFASLFTDRAIHYRQTRGFDHLTIALSVGVQKMVRSDAGSSGVMFSIDTETGFPDVVLINAAYGLGESVVQGTVNPDEYVVFKPTLKQGFRPILRRRVGSKEIKIVYDAGGSRMTRTVPVPQEERGKLVLQDDEILPLAHWAVLIEEHYSGKRGSVTPMDIEWAKDGLTGELFVVQARPETVHSQKLAAVLRKYRLREKGTELASGRAVGEAIATGSARVIVNAAQMGQLLPGEILFTEKTDPDWEPVIKKAGAVVTDQGGRTCHAAIVARELGISAVVGTLNGTTSVSSGTPVTVSCAEGEVGRVYRGQLAFDVEEIEIAALPPSRTKILMNVGSPADVFHLAALPNDGVGLARIEFIIASQIQVHPMALVRWPNLKDRGAKTKIEQLTSRYADKSAYFVDLLSEGVGMIAAAFYPKPVVVRLSDFKTNEYANLTGGAEFEPSEENPMIGWRGASRYYDERYREGFALECKALRRVRDDMGLTNVIIMVPFCRTPEEGIAVIAEMANNRLTKGQNGLQIYVMCELPSNVIAADEFSEIFDGFSIGSNDLTQLILGVDRDSALVARLFDERNIAVKRAIASVIHAAKRHGRTIGICGQAPSDYPEFARFLVSEGIDSISLNPDSLLKMRLVIAETEAEASAPPTKGAPA